MENQAWRLTNSRLTKATSATEKSKGPNAKICPEVGRLLVGAGLGPMAGGGSGTGVHLPSAPTHTAPRPAWTGTEAEGPTSSGQGTSASLRGSGCGRAARPLGGRLLEPLPNSRMQEPTGGDPCPVPLLASSLPCRVLSNSRC